MRDTCRIAVIPGDGVGTEVTSATLAVIDAARRRIGGFALSYETIHAGASYYSESGRDIEADGEERAGQADAIFLGAIGLPSIRATDGTEICPHLRLREKYELYAGVRPIKAYPNAPQLLVAPEATNLDIVIIRECTEGLFYTAAVHNRSPKTDANEAREGGMEGPPPRKICVFLHSTLSSHLPRYSPAEGSGGRRSHHLP